MSGLWGDFKLAARMLARRPGFTAVAVITLALGIGANTAIFSVVNGVMFRPLPVPDADRLVALTETEQGSPFPHGLSHPNFLDYKALNEVFADATVFTPTFLRMSVEGRAATRMIPEVVGPNFFEMLGVQAARGRTFRARDVEGAGAGNVLVLSHSAWQRLFAGDPSIIGKTVRLNDQLVTILGVTPEEFHGTVGNLEVDGFVPLRGMELLDPTYKDYLEDRSADGFRVIAKLQPGVSLAEARAAVAVQSTRLASEYPEANRQQTVLVHPEPMARLEPAAVGFLPPLAMVFMGLVSLVLVIACANVANLMVARGMAREKEMAIRLSLGAGRRHVMRQLMVESLLLALAGGAAALLIAQWAVSALSSVTLATDLPIRMDFSVDRHVLLFALGAALVTGLVTGLLPGLRAGRAELVGSLKEGGRGSGVASGRHTLRNGLVVAQVCVSVALLVCAGLFVRTARNATDIDLGFELDHRAMLTFDMGLAGYDEERGRAFHEDLLERVRSLPVVVSAATGQYVPVGYMNEGAILHIEGKVDSPDEPPKQSLFNVVTPDFFRTMGTPVLEGREFTVDDQADARPVAIVNQALADAYWPGEESLGQHIRVNGPEEPLLEVVGVVKTARYALPAESPIPMIYRPYAQSYRSSQVLFVQTAGDPLAALPAIRTQIQALDPGMPLFDVRTLESHIRDGKGKMFGLAATLVGLFGLIGAILASIGLYGVTAYAVSQRRHEIGVRMALGARPEQILSMVLRQGVVLTSIGVGLGLLIAAFATRSFANLLVGVSPTDPLTFGGVALVLIGVALVASAVPARQAAGVDPMVALHYE
jgi:predicted permease